MARQTVGFFEQHVEKVVVGIAAAAFVLVTVVYLIGTPNQISVNNRMCDPGDVDLVVKDAAQRLRSALHNAPPREHPTRTWVAEFQQKQLQGLSAIWASREMSPPLPGGLDVPKLDESSAVVGSKGTRLELAEVVPPSKPEVIAGRAACYLREDPIILAGAMANLPGLPPLTEEERQLLPTEDRDWVTVVTTLDLDKQYKEFHLKGYAPERTEIYVVQVLAERQVRQANGGWASAWEPVSPYSRCTLPPQPRVRVIQRGANRYDLSPEDQDTLLVFLDTVRAHQETLMRPQFPLIVHGEPWDLPDLPGVDPALLKVFTGDAGDGFGGGMRGPVRPLPRGEGLMDMRRPRREAEVEGVMRRPRREEGPIRRPVDAQPRQPAVTPPGDRPLDIRSARKQILEDLKEAKKLANDPFRLDEAVAKVERVLVDPAALPSHIKLAKELEAELDVKLKEKMRKDLERKLADPGGPMPGPGGVQDDQAAKLQQSLVWLHDLDVEPGRSYRYRVKVQLMNRYAGVASRLANPSDAEKVVIESNWSEPSKAIETPKDVQFFLVRHTPKARVQVFKWYKGRQVEESFPVGPGESIGGPKKITIYPPPDFQKTTVPVDFATGATVLDIDLARELTALDPIRRNPRDLKTIPTVAMTYVDRFGQVLERVLYEDRRSDVRKRLEDEAAELMELPRRRRLKAEFPGAGAREPRDRTARGRADGTRTERSRADRSRGDGTRTSRADRRGTGRDSGTTGRERRSRRDSGEDAGSSRRSRGG